MRRDVQQKTVASERVWKVLGSSIPEAPIMLAAVLYTHWHSLENALASVAPFYPVAVFAAGALLGWQFHRSRLLFALLLLGIADRAVSHYATGHAMARDHVVFQAVALLLPLNLAALPLTGERGVITPPGLMRLGVILGQIVLVGTLDRVAAAPAAALLHARVLPHGLFEWTALADPALLAFCTSGGLVIAGQLLAPTSAERSFAWALIPAFLGLSGVRPGSPGFSTFYFATSALILIVGVARASYHMAYRDSLTGLPARRALTEALERLGAQYSVAMVDVDHFKRINDTHGHDVGDQVLRMIAARLAQVGGGARAYRYGGEEFAVIFPGKTLEECRPELETLRGTVEGTRFILRRRLRSRRKKEKVVTDRGRGERVPVTISIGVAVKTDRFGKPEEVIQAADRALYRAKAGGRNQIQTE